MNKIINSSTTANHPHKSVRYKSENTTEMKLLRCGKCIRFKLHLLRNAHQTSVHGCDKLPHTLITWDYVSSFVKNAVTIKIQNVYKKLKWMFTGWPRHTRRPFLADTHHKIQSSFQSSNVSVTNPKLDIVLNNGTAHELKKLGLVSNRIINLRRAFGAATCSRLYDISIILMRLNDYPC